MSSLPLHHLQGEVFLGETLFHAGVPDPFRIILYDIALHVIEHIPFPLCGNRHRRGPGPLDGPGSRALNIRTPGLLHLGTELPAPAADLKLRTLHTDQLRDAANRFSTHFALHNLTNTLYADFPIYLFEERMGDILRDTAEPQSPEELCRLYRTLSEQLRDQLQQIENDKHEIETQMLDRVSNLESRNLELREQLRQIEADKRYIETQKIRYEREVRKLKSESEQLRSPPLIIGTVVDVIDSSRVIVRSSAGPRFLVRTSPSINPEDLKAGARCTLNQQSLAIVELLPSSFDAQVYGMELVDSPQESYSDIGGLKEQINEIREAVELPLKRPELFTRIGIEPPKGVLLHGPPGTGKTLLAKAVAHETNAHFMRVVGSELVQKYIGEGARLVRELFDLAKKKSPTIIFIDEIDAVGASRTEANTSGDREVQRTLMQLLAGMDGFENRGDVKIIGATNRIDILDKALLRPGRFDRIIEIPLPDEEGRLSILKVHTRALTMDESVILSEIAGLTDGKNGADLRAICMEAGMFAIRNERSAITREDFLAAIDKIRLDFNRGVPDVEGRMFA